MPDLLIIAAIVLAAISAFLFIAGYAAFRKRHLLGSTASATLALLFLALAALSGTISIATQGYRALTHEEVAAVVQTRSTGERSFEALFLFPDGHSASYQLAGDQLYVDAHILKWKPIANLVGLHTAYELDRVAGRFAQLGEEQRQGRTVYALSTEKPLDMFNLRQRYALLSPLLDVEYGSATFVPANRTAEFEIRVSTSGLLVREVTE